MVAAEYPNCPAPRLRRRHPAAAQWTDTVTGNISPVVLHTGNALRVAFISYYKGENQINAITGDKPLATVASDDFGRRRRPSTSTRR